MKKSIHFICLPRFFSILAAIFMAFSAWAVFTEPVSAAGDLPRLVDEAGLLSDSEKTALLHQLDEISERQQVDLGAFFSQYGGKRLVHIDGRVWDYGSDRCRLRLYG